MSTATEIKRWGATLDEWSGLIELRIAADLLPVVSNQNAKIMPGSALKNKDGTPGTLGKIPSCYYGNPKMVGGIKEWTKKNTTPKEIEQWKQEPDYGICIQTRYVRAFDCDITDAALAQKVRDFITEKLRASVGDPNFPIKARTRNKSPKFLIPFVFDGELTKRIITTAHGNIELLATGQQFVACGTHPSGVRYEWLDGLPEGSDLIVMESIEEVDALWKSLQAEFGVAPPVEVKASTRKEVQHTAIDNDPVAQYLLKHDMVIEIDSKTGAMFVECPNKGQHSMDSGPSETVYYPANTGGYAHGGFDCKHAHCLHIKHPEFKSMIGYTDEDVLASFTDLDATVRDKARSQIETLMFCASMVGDSAEVICAGVAKLIPDAEYSDQDREGLFLRIAQATQKPVEEISQLIGANSLAIASPLPAFKRNVNGEILPSKENVTRALRRPDLCGYQLRHDAFRDEIMLAPTGDDQWRAFQDSDYHELCLKLEHGGQGFKDIAKERIRDSVAYVAQDYIFDSAQDWLGRQKWDGVHRVENFLHDYMGAADTPYTRAVGLYFWTALAGRVLQPGIKADMVPVAVGPQGVMKSSAVAAIVPAPEYFLELDLSSSDDDLARLMRGRLVIEFGELKGLRARELEHVKAFISRTHESWVPKFKEMPSTYARRGMFFGTTNKDEFLIDDTGHRRWLPFRVTQCNPDAVKRDRGQLWAEARDLFAKSGVQWVDAENLARGEHDQFVVRDPWEELVERWLNTVNELDGTRPGDDPFTAVDALMYGVRLDARNINQSAKDRMSRVLKELGYARTLAYIGGKRARAYVKGA